MAHAARSLSVIAATAFITLSICPVEAGPQSLEVLATVRTNHRTESLTFRIPAHQAHVSELRIRSGSLAVTLAGIEIEFADGRQHRALLQETLPPGHQSQPIPIEPHRAVTRVFVTKRPGLQPGETVIQLLGKVER
ncbi:MAG: hypothetical protein J0H65_04255 [Rhizobiales bacterium]|nr:hypothetical protein [Hyphomicrobiales bacterium]